jgi:hypothetical protein
MKPSYNRNPSKYKASCIAWLNFLSIALCIAASPVSAGAQSVITTYAGGSPLQLSFTLSITEIGIGSPFSVLSDGAGGFHYVSGHKYFAAAVLAGLIAATGRRSQGRRRSRGSTSSIIQRVTLLTLREICSRDPSNYRT